MDDSSASYIHLVHRLIEECILFNMSKEECMEALSKHANIKPVITSTVWKELEKENKEFFETYSKSIAEAKLERASDDSEREASKRIHNLRQGMEDETAYDDVWRNRHSLIVGTCGSRSKHSTVTERGR